MGCVRNRREYEIIEKAINQNNSVDYHCLCSDRRYVDL